MIHILNQYIWPDCAPTAIYAELLASCLERHGYGVRLVGGTGVYRSGQRRQPSVEIKRLPVYLGSRGRIISTLFEYRSVYAAFEQYVRAEVERGDIVIGTSAPPQAFGLIRAIRGRGAMGIYWLQDYYPELLRGVVDYPSPLRACLSRYWNGRLEEWDRVVKISDNLAYYGSNAVVIRNGPTLDLGEPQACEPGTACYFGNLGYGHCLDSFLGLCSDLRQRGYTITLIGDGPKVAQLPSWVSRERLAGERELAARHWRAEIHLVAADPKMTGAVFPSKYWNSRLSGRTIATSGFSGAMREELGRVEALTVLPSPDEWIPLLRSLAGGG